jgi:hypothetical protein
MSTRSSIVYGDSYHLYEDVIDEQLYLELTGKIDFEVHPEQLVVRIDDEVIEAILAAADKIRERRKSTKACSWKKREER